MIDVLTRAHAHGEHMRALARHANGAPMPEPDREIAAAIVTGYWLLLDENEELKREVGQLTADRPPLPFETCPALERWRAAVLEDRRRSPLERVAAWELTALQCEADGNLELAEAARETARLLVSRSAA